MYEGLCFVAAIEAHTQRCTLSHTDGPSAVVVVKEEVAGDVALGRDERGVAIPDGCQVRDAVPAVEATMVRCLPDLFARTGVGWGGCQ